MIYKRLVSRRLFGTASREEIISCREKYLAPSLRTFQAFDRPFILTKGEMQYMYNEEGEKFIDLLGQNLCVSVGHAHPKVVDAAVT